MTVNRRRDTGILGKGSAGAQAQRRKHIVGDEVGTDTRETRKHDGKRLLSCEQRSSLCYVSRSRESS